jgi:hypothetical protein
MPSFSYHVSAGLLGPNPSAANFYSARVLWDEAMADAARRFVRARPGSLLVALQGADHVKFRLGSVARLQRPPPAPDAAPPLRVRSVLLNPTAEDAEPGAGRRPGGLRLGLTYGPGPAGVGGVLRLADYVWFSGPEEARQLPPAAVLKYLRN